VIGRSSSRLRHDSRKPQHPKVKLVDKHVDHPNRVLFRDIVIQIFWKQDGLPAILTLDEARFISNPEAVASGF